MRAASCAGGRRVATPDMPDVFRHSLSDPDPAPRHSMSDPRYTYTKTFGGAIIPRLAWFIVPFDLKASQVQVMSPIVTLHWPERCRLGPAELRQQPGLEHAGSPVRRRQGPAAAPCDPACRAPWLRPRPLDLYLLQLSLGLQGWHVPISGSSATSGRHKSTLSNNVCHLFCDQRTCRDDF